MHPAGVPDRLERNIDASPGTAVLLFSLSSTTFITAFVLLPVQVAPVPAPSGTVTCTLAWASTAGPSPPLVMSHGPYHATNTTNQGCTSVQDIAAVGAE